MHVAASVWLGVGGQAASLVCPCAEGRQSLTRPFPYARGQPKA